MPSPPSTLRPLVALAALLLPAVAGAQPIELSLKVSPQAGTTADEFTATVQIVSKGVAGPDRYWPPDFGDFTIVNQHTQTSTQWTYDPTHGQEIRTVETRRYVLRAGQAGKLTIGAARIRLDGKDYETKPVVVTVQEGGTAPGTTSPAGPPTGSIEPGDPSPGMGQVTFLHAVADHREVFLGEQVTVTWLVYTRTDILKFEPRVPKLDDFSVVKLYEPQNYFTWREEQVGGRPYITAVVARSALFPTRAGKVVVPAYEANVTTMHTPFGSPQRIASPALELVVKPLPEGAPAGFDPAHVGAFALDAQVDRETVPAGESLVLTLTVKATGPVQRTRTPTLELDGFDVYPPRDFEEHIDTTGDVVRGERRYQYLLTPKKGGKLAAGPVELAYFDPATGKYDVARVAAIPVTVVGDPAAIAAGTPGGSGRENLIARDIRPPREVPAAASRAVAQFFGTRPFWLSLAVPPVAFVLVVFGDKVRERLRRDTPRARLRRARGRARKRMRVAELHIRGGRAGKFFGEVARVLYEHIEERVGEPVTAMTREQLREFLPAHGFPDDTVDALVKELENCDFARFAPSASGPGEMRAALRRVKTLLGAIERVRPPAQVKEAA